MTPVEIRAAISASPELQAMGTEHGAIAAALSLGRTKLGTVSTAAFASWAGGTGMRAVIEDKATTVGDPLRSSALALRDVLSGGADGVRMDHAENEQMLAAWVSLGMLSSANHDSLIALATVDDPVSVQQVIDALKG
jgi:hypothetical protein